MDAPFATRVLMTADTVGGVWTYALSLARALAPRGVFFNLATLGAPLSPAQWRDANALPNIRIHESRYKLEWMPDPWDDVHASGDWLLDLAAQTRPDLVHLNGFAHGALPFRAPTLVVGHSCVLSWWQAVKGHSAPPEWDRYHQAVHRGLHHASAIAAPTRALLHDLCTLYGPFPAATPALVLPNTREPTLFPFCPPPEKEPFIFAAGRLWDEAKNLASLAALAPKLPWPVYLAGETAAPGRNLTPPSHLPQMAFPPLLAARSSPREGVPATHSSSANVNEVYPQAGSQPAHYLGHLAPSDLAAHLHRAAIYTLPARYEPFGLSVLEAALSGCALVLGDIPSLREVWTPDCALFVDPSDPNALRDALLRLITAPDLRAHMAHTARDRALRLYTPALFADAYARSYAALLTSSLPTPTLSCA